MIVYRAQDFYQGNIPTAEGMRAVAEEIRRTCSKYPFIGGAYVGSYPRLRLTSDIDAIVLYEPRARDLAHQIRQEIYHRANLHHVNLADFLILALDEATGCTHTIGPGYFNHIQWCVQTKDTGFGGNILPYIKPFPSALESARSYYAQKRRKLDELKLHCHESSSAQWYELIEEILSTPFYLLLRLAEAEGISGGSSKEEIIKLAKEYVPLRLPTEGQMIPELLKRINKLRDRVSELTEAVAGREASIETYLSTLHRAADQVGPVDKAYQILGPRINQLVLEQLTTRTNVT